MNKDEIIKELIAIINEIDCDPMANEAICLMSSDPMDMFKKVVKEYNK